MFPIMDLWNTTMERFTIFQRDISHHGSGKYNGNVLPFFSEIFPIMDLWKLTAMFTIFSSWIYGKVYQFSGTYFSHHGFVKHNYGKD